MNITAISSSTKQSEPVYSTDQALNVNLVGQGASSDGSGTTALQTTEVSHTPLGYQQFTDLTAAVSLTVPSGARIAVLQADVAAVRYRDDGTAPTTDIGMLLYVGDFLNYTGDLSAIQFIAGANGAILNVSYYS